MNRPFFLSLRIRIEKLTTSVTGILGFAFLLITGSASAQCGIDIQIANDQSGSVTAKSNQQGRNFIKNLTQNIILGNGNTESRVAISNWSQNNTWVEYNFPAAGANYTTLQSDVISYANAPRTMYGGTDAYSALQKTYNIINQTPVTGRTVPKIIILMTDGYCNQVQNGITSMASQIKASGVKIMVLAVGPAASCTILQGTNVASPGMYFSAANYNALESIQ